MFGGYCGACYRSLPEPVRTFLNFSGDQASWTFAFVMSQLLFWIYAFPLFAQYGYVDRFNDNGQVVSGPSGSGAFPVSLMLMVVGAILFAKKFVEYDPKESFLAQFPTGTDGEPLVPKERKAELAKFKDD